MCRTYVPYVCAVPIRGAFADTGRSPELGESLVESGTGMNANYEGPTSTQTYFHMHQWLLLRDG